MFEEFLCRLDLCRLKGLLPVFVRGRSMSPGGPPMSFRGFVCRLELGEPAMSARGPHVSTRVHLISIRGPPVNNQRGILCPPEISCINRSASCVGQRVSYINHFRRPSVSARGPSVSIRGPPVPVKGPPVPIVPPVPIKGPSVPARGHPVPARGPPLPARGPPVPARARAEFPIQLVGATAPPTFGFAPPTLCSVPPTSVRFDRFLASNEHFPVWRHDNIVRHTPLPKLSVHSDSPSSHDAEWRQAWVCGLLFIWSHILSIYHPSYRRVLLPQLTSSSWYASAARNQTLRSTSLQLAHKGYVAPCVTHFLLLTQINLNKDFVVKFTHRIVQLSVRQWSNNSICDIY